MQGLALSSDIDLRFSSLLAYMRVLQCRRVRFYSIISNTHIAFLFTIFTPGSVRPAMKLIV
jgi:hypothetical protein